MLWRYIFYKCKRYNCSRIYNIKKNKKLDKLQIHKCDENTSLVGIGELIGATDIIR